MAAVALAALTAIPSAQGATSRPASVRPASAIGPMDWPTYGHDAHHTFVGSTSLQKSSITNLTRAWFFPTGDAVTANPIVVGDTVYAGSWDGNFYAVNRATGAKRWQFAIKPQPSVSPQPGSFPRDVTSDGGLITSSAWFQPAQGGEPDLVIFGGGYTMYALEAATGKQVWAHDYTGLPEKPADPAHDDTRIFSSPVVVGNRVLFGVTSDGSNGKRGYVVAADLASGNPLWKFETDVSPTTGKVRNDGCGGVWSSPTIIEKLGLLVLDVADCNFTDARPYDESVFALHIADGTPLWVFHPGPDPHCDFDFGATANLGTAADGTPTFLGVGRKDGTYYSLDPYTGALRWQRNVVFGGFAGGFIATTAYDGKRVYGATALGDFGRFEGVGSAGCELGNPRDTPVQEPSMHSIDATTGQVAWEGELSQSFGATSVAGGMTFVGTGIVRSIQIRDADTGTMLDVIPLLAPSDSGVVVSGNALFFGQGSSEQAQFSGISAYTPLGVAPTAPAAAPAPAPQPAPQPAPSPGVQAARGRRLPETGNVPVWPVALGVLALGAGAATSRLRRRFGP